jgi:16S rRNA (guanine527-N7)-methyltransferase
MDEVAARAWLDVPRETCERLERLVESLRSENQKQNLVSAASLDQVWQRHIVDSAQLLRFGDRGEGPWLDLGTGAGFPGLVIALLRPGPVTLVESRKLRVTFLERARDELGLGSQVEIIGSSIEAVQTRTFDVISARAFAPLDRLLNLADRFAAPATRWVLPKGKNAKSELEAARGLWQGNFRLEPSVTDPEAMIIVADQVRRLNRDKQRR